MPHTLSSARSASRRRILTGRDHRASRPPPDSPGGARRWLRGHVVTDLVVDAVARATTRPMLVAGLPGATSTETPGRRTRPAARRGRHRGLGAAFPAEGDPVGLGGPADVQRRGAGGGRGGRGRRHRAGAGAAAHRRRGHLDGHPAPTAPAARRGRGRPPAPRGAAARSADELARLDVARWRPEVADGLMNLRHREPVTAPTACPPLRRPRRRGLQASEIVELALEDDGGAVIAPRSRRAALRSPPAGPRRAARADRPPARPRSGRRHEHRPRTTSLPGAATPAKPETLLITLTGTDRLGVTSAVFSALSSAGVEVLGHRADRAPRQADPRRARDRAEARPPASSRPSRRPRRARHAGRRRAGRRRQPAIRN